MLKNDIKKMKKYPKTKRINDAQVYNNIYVQYDILNVTSLLFNRGVLKWITITKQKMQTIALNAELYHARTTADMKIIVH